MQVTVTFEDEKFGDIKHSSQMQRKQGSAVIEAVKLPCPWNGTAQGAQPLEHQNWVILDLCGCSCSDSAFQAPSYGSS